MNESFLDMEKEFIIHIYQKGSVASEKEFPG